MIVALLKTADQNTVGDCIIVLYAHKQEYITIGGTGEQVGDEECQRLAPGLRQLHDLQRLELRGDASAISEAGAKVLFRAVQEAPLHEGISLSQPARELPCGELRSSRW